MLTEWNWKGIGPDGQSLRKISCNICLKMPFFVDKESLRKHMKVHHEFYFFSDIQGNAMKAHSIRIFKLYTEQWIRTPLGSAES